jgi:hypothetical protein
MAQPAHLARPRWSAADVWLAHHLCLGWLIYTLQKLEVSSLHLLNSNVILHSGRVHRKFLPIGKMLKLVLNEHVTPVTCWKALFAFSNSDGTTTCIIVCRPFDSLGRVEQDGGVLPESSSKMRCCSLKT